MKQRFYNYSPEMAGLAVAKYMEGKWRRNDTLSFIEKVCGIPRHEIILSGSDPKYAGVKAEALTGLKLFLEGVCEDFLYQGIEPDIDPVTVSRRPDGMTGKLRDIAMLCVTHQLLEHIAAEMLMPFFNSRFLPCQHASIPGHGQIRLSHQLRRTLLKRFGIKVYDKTDVVQAYKSTSYALVISIIEESIPKAKDIIKILRFLAKWAPNGCLIIGGYLDAWLFNLVMSYALRYAMTLGRTRRGKFTGYVVGTQAYMDDVSFLCRSISASEKTVKALKTWMKRNLGLEIKVVVKPTRLLSVEEEKARRHEKKASKRACPGIDMAGFVVHRTYTTVRARVFLKARRQFLRGWAEIEKTGTVRLIRADKICSYKGYFIAKPGNPPPSDSLYAIKKYKIKELCEIAEKVKSFHGRDDARKEKERKNDYRKCVNDYIASVSNARGTSGWPPAYPYVKGCRDH